MFYIHRSLYCLLIEHIQNGFELKHTPLQRDDICAFLLLQSHFDGYADKKLVEMNKFLNISLEMPFIIKVRVEICTFLKMIASISKYRTTFFPVLASANMKINPFHNEQDVSTLSNFFFQLVAN